MIQKRYKLTSDLGLHARPATTLVKICNDFTSNITIKYQETEVNFKSIMGVLSLGAYKGEIILIKADGDDEITAMDRISYEIMEMKLGKEI